MQSSVRTNILPSFFLFGVPLFSYVYYTVFIYYRTRRKKTLNEIGRVYLTTSNTRPNDARYVGGDKIIKGFTEDYEHILAPFKEKANVRFMEIGVWYGKSLAMWADWFQSATIIGIDIHLKRFFEHKPELERLGAFRQRNPLEVHEFDTSSEQFESWFRAQKPPMDVVLDDGNHTAKSQWQLFALIFPLLAPAGIYIIEDIEEPLEFFCSDDVMSGFPALLATLADPEFMKTKKFRKRWIAGMKEKARQRCIDAKKAVDGLRARVAQTTDDNEKDQLKKILKEKESELSSMLQGDKNQMDEQKMWEASNEKRDAVEGLVKDLSRVEIRHQNVVFYKKEHSTSYSR